MTYQSVSRACCEAVEARRLLAFVPAVNYPVDVHPRSVAGGDFNNDGRADLVTANAQSSSVSFLAGDASGGFHHARHFAVGLGPLSVAAGDFDDDGELDVAVLRFDGEIAWVSVLHGRGDGTFDPPVHTSVWEEPLALAAADFNADGRCDLVYSFVDLLNWENPVVTVLLSDGQGGFAVSLDRTTDLNGSDPVGLAVGDVNGDGKVDVITANNQAGTVSVLLGNGDGTLSYDWNDPRNFAAGQASPRSIALGDFTGDGETDIVVAGTTVATLRGRGDGTFDAAIALPGGGSSHTAVATADFNGDGSLDAVVTDGGAGTVSVMLGNGGGGLRYAGAFIVGGVPSALVVGDFNADGRPDVATANAGSNSVSALLNDGILATKTFIGAGGPGSGGDWAGPANWSPSGVPTADDFVLVAGRVVNLGSSVTLAGLTLSGGATLNIGPSGGRVLRTAAISFTGNSTLNLGSSAMIVDYHGESPMPAVRAALSSGFAAGSWGGTGITSSAAAAAPGTGLSFAESPELFGTFPATFAGQSVDDTAILLRYTLLGDANADGSVDLADFARLAANFNRSRQTFAGGNFNYDAAGAVDVADFSILAAAFNRTLTDNPLTRPANGVGTFRGGGGRFAEPVLPVGRFLIDPAVPGPWPLPQ